MLKALQKTAYPGPQGPVVLAILDGVGLSDYVEGNAVRSACTPHLDGLTRSALSTSLKAHGVAVGLPSDEDMGNSEVGHNAIGCGRVFAQGAKLVTEAAFFVISWTVQRYVIFHAEEEREETYGSMKIRRGYHDTEA